MEKITTAACTVLIPVNYTNAPAVVRSLAPASPPFRMTSLSRSTSGRIRNHRDVRHRLLIPALTCWKMPKLYYVYILSSQRRVLYTGMTSNIEQRVFQHKTHAFGGFTAKYNVTSLVYLERHGNVMTAIRREKEMKARRREEKIRLIESENPKWKDLSYGWYQRHRYQPDLSSAKFG